MMDDEISTFDLQKRTLHCARCVLIRGKPTKVILQQYEERAHRSTVR